MTANGRVWYDGVLNIPEGKIGSWEIKHKIEPPHHKFLLGTPRTTLSGDQEDSARIVSYPYETRWHKLSEDGNVWMSDIPLEQKQHDTLLQGFHGRVLVGGLGLGYAAAVLQAMPGVTEIVVVELQSEVIQLVWPSVKASKASIVHGDLFAYLDGPQGEFECGFYDIWQSASGPTFDEVVVPLRRKSKGKVAVVKCWNEDIMRGQLYLSLVCMLGLLRNPHAIPNGRTRDQLLETLTDDDGSVHIRWSIPFFRQVADCIDWVDDPAWEEVAHDYVSMYAL